MVAIICRLHRHEKLVSNLKIVFFNKSGIYVAISWPGPIECGMKPQCLTRPALYRGIALNIWHAHCTCQLGETERHNLKAWLMIWYVLTVRSQQIHQKSSTSTTTYIRFRGLQRKWDCVSYSLNCCSDASWTTTWLSKETKKYICLLCSINKKQMS